jgi:acetyl esterase/lipase
VRWVRAHAAEWDLDPSMVIVAGASAGGQLAALLGVAPGEHVDPDLEPDLASTSPVVQGVLDFVGPTDFATFPLAGGWAPPLTAFYLDCPGATGTNCDPAVVKDASVATHLTSAAPPAFLEYGAFDTLVVPATQGLPLALEWTAARGELSKEPLFTRGVWYELAGGLR